MTAAEYFAKATEHLDEAKQVGAHNDALEAVHLQYAQTYGLLAIALMLGLPTQGVNLP